MQEISVSLALEGLSETVAALTEAQATVDRLYKLRDDFIADARDNGVSYIAISERTGLSRQQIYNVSSSRAKIEVTE